MFAAAAALGFLLLLLINIEQYGMTWDSPENLLTGRHYFNFYTTGERQWLDFGTYDTLYRDAGEDRPLLYTRNFNYPERYTPFANVVSAAAQRLFTENAGWVPDYVGYNLGVVAFAMLAVFVLACFTWQAFGPLASVAATLALVTYPLFFEHAHNNPKDVPFAALVLLALWSYWQGERSGHRAWLFLSALATGAALATRVTAAEVWLIIGLAYLPQAWKSRPNGFRSASRAYRPLLWHVPLALTTFLALWPWLWPDPIGRLRAHLAFGSDVSRGLRVLYNGAIRHSGETLPWHYTLVIFILSTPLVTLAGGMAGLGAALACGVRRRDAAAIMFALLFLLALLRTSLPFLPQYDGTRHMMDGIVGFAGLFGLGFSVFWEALRRRWPRLSPAVAAVALGLLFAPVIIMLARLHPFQGIYYNTLAGGPRGAYDRFPQEYWGSSYALGTRWINENTEPDALILARVAGQLANNYLSGDRRIIPDEALPSLSPDTIVYVAYITRRDKYDWIVEYADAALAPVFVLERGGVPVLKVIRTEAGVLQSAQP